MAFWRVRKETAEDSERVLKDSARERAVVESAIADLRSILDKLEEQLESDDG